MKDMSYNDFIFLTIGRALSETGQTQRPGLRKNRVCVRERQCMYVRVYEKHIPCLLTPGNIGLIVYLFSSFYAVEGCVQMCEGVQLSLSTITCRNQTVMTRWKHKNQKRCMVTLLPQSIIIGLKLIILCVTFLCNITHFI